ncbi:MAG: hypothetical protein OQK50_00595 [Deltaproteobacteria bacterium]|jgi:hypothetical protein|nr:hypothetical protein [Deltaproteobacteria bacterium]MCW9048809.1 hypothetical protein [Deltaproteobacteria bacterium]
MNKVNVVLTDGRERTLEKDELQYLLTTKRVMFFERSDGWIVCGRDKLRREETAYPGGDRRAHTVFAQDNWY